MMDTSFARQLLTDTVKQPFERSRFQQLIRYLVNDLDESTLLTDGDRCIREAYKSQVHQCQRIGQYIDPENNIVDVLWVQLKDATTLERSRDLQRNFVGQYLQDRGNRSAALVAYYADESPDWRFSWVQVDDCLEPHNNDIRQSRKTAIAVRRVSFLLGPDGPNRIIQQRLLPLVWNTQQNPTLKEIEAAFSLEALTKEFLEQYRALF